MIMENDITRTMEITKKGIENARNTAHANNECSFSPTEVQSDILEPVFIDVRNPESCSNTSQYFLEYII